MGNGTYHPGTGASPGKFDLHVAFQYTANPTMIAKWKAAFEDASRRLFDATDGQMCFGKITYSNSSAGTVGADAKLFKRGDSEAYLRIDQAEGHMRLGNNQALKHPYDILHEFGHYGLYLEDEYLGPGGDGTCTEHADGEHACVMEFTSDYADKVSEFCSAANHGPNNFQEACWGMSCWDRMGMKYGDLVVPTDRPSSTAEDPPPPMGWEEKIALSRAMVVLDFEEPGELRETLAAVLARMQKGLNRMNDVDFIDQQALLTNGKAKPPFFDRLNEIPAQFDSMVQAATQKVLFVSDQFPIVDDKTAALADNYRRVDLQFHGLGVTAADGFSTMQQLGEKTRGSTRFSTPATNGINLELTSTFANMIVEMIEHFAFVLRETRVLPASTDALKQLTNSKHSQRIAPDPCEESIPFLVEENASMALFMLTSDPTDELGFSLVQPDGTVLLIDDTADIPVKLLQVENPAAGRWVLRVHREYHSKAASFIATVAVRNRCLRSHMSVRKIATNRYKVEAGVITQLAVAQLEPAGVDVVRIQGNREERVAYLPLASIIECYSDTGLLGTELQLDEPGRYLLRIRLTNAGTANLVRTRSANGSLPSGWANTSTVAPFVREMEVMLNHD